MTLFPGWEDRQRKLQALVKLSSPPPQVPLDVTFLFEKLTLDLWRVGFTRYSARAVLHRIRWHFHVERGDRMFKANNNWTPDLARWLMAKYPFLEDFFETRITNGERLADLGLLLRDEDDDDLS